jgi:hypothetical protein
MIKFIKRKIEQRKKETLDRKIANYMESKKTLTRSELIAFVMGTGQNEIKATAIVGVLLSPKPNPYGKGDYQTMFKKMQTKKKQTFQVRGNSYFLVRKENNG